MAVVMACHLPFQKAFLHSEKPFAMHSSPYSATNQASMSRDTAF